MGNCRCVLSLVRFAQAVLVAFMIGLVSLKKAQ